MRSTSNPRHLDKAWGRLPEPQEEPASQAAPGPDFSLQLCETVCLYFIMQLAVLADGDSTQAASSMPLCHLDPFIPTPLPRWVWEAASVQAECAKDPLLGLSTLHHPWSW